MLEHFKELSNELQALTPKAIVIVSAHWEESMVSVTSTTKPHLLYDYYGFPDSTYSLQYPAPSDPALSDRIVSMLKAKSVPARLDNERGWDHGVFIPLLLLFPKAEIPVVQVSLRHTLDPAEHILIGQALEPLRSEDVLIIGSGYSFHNMQAFFSPSVQNLQKSKLFDDYLNAACSAEAKERNQQLIDWAKAPQARFAHPREEHLIPLHVIAGCAGDDIGVTHAQYVMSNLMCSSFRFG